VFDGHINESNYLSHLLGL